MKSGSVHLLLQLILAGFLSLFALSCKDPSRSTPQAFRLPGPGSEAATNPSNGGFPTPPRSGGAAAPQGTADGSGGETEKSGIEVIDHLLRDPQEPHRNLRRSLKIAFHRIENFDQKGELKTVLERMSRPPEGQSLFQAIDSLKFAMQKEACESEDGRRTAMAARGNKICMSSDLLSLVPPDALPRQMLALLAHEFAHVRGIESEHEANLLQYFFIEHYESLTTAAPDFTYFQQYLSNALLLFEMDEASEHQRLYGRCYLLSFALEELKEVKNSLRRFPSKKWDMMQVSSSAPYRLDQLMNAGREMETDHCRKTSVLQSGSLKNRQLPRTSEKTEDFRENILWILLRTHELQNELNEAASPFFRLPPGLSAHAARQMLFYNAMKDQMERGRIRVSPASLTCEVDGDAVKFQSGACPAPTHNTWNGVNGQGPYFENTYIYDDLLCARVELKAQEGQNQVLHFMVGNRSLGDGEFGEAQKTIEDVLALQILVNVENFRDMGTEFANVSQERPSFLKVEGQNLGTAQNNVSLVTYRNPKTQDLIRSQSLSAVFHPETTREISVQIQLPAGFDSQMETIRFEETRHQIRCRIQ